MKSDKTSETAEKETRKGRDEKTEAEAKSEAGAA